MDKIKFKDLSLDDMKRINELILIKDKFKAPFLESKGLEKLDLGEIFYLNYFDCFEKETINDRFISINNMEFYRVLYNLMNNNFSINYINNANKDNLELVFANKKYKSLAFLESNSDDNLINFRLITPIDNKIIVNNNLPNLEEFINTHEFSNWPLVSYHKPYLLNSNEISYINSLSLDEEEKILKMMDMDFNKLLKLKDGEDIYGYANKLMFNHFLLNKPKSYIKKR